MKKYELGDIIIITVAILLIIVLSPIWVPILIFVLASDAHDNFRFKRFIRANDGAKYFCYTLRKNSLDFVRDLIIPRLPPETIIIYITDKYDNVGDDSKFRNQIVWGMAGMKKGFPCMAKFSDGQMITESINHEVYQSIVRKQGADKVLRKVDKFFGQQHNGEHIVD